MYSERDPHVDQGLAEVLKGKVLFGFGFYRVQEARLLPRWMH